MTTQVRTFTLPKPLGETLSTSTPRSVPNYPEFPRLNGNGGSTLPRIKPSPKPNSTPNTMSYAHEQPSAGDGITFSHQDKLPKLPIPELERTCQKYLQVLRPLQTSREHAETRHAVDEFLRSDGPELQEKLKSYAEGRTSYIEQFCKSIQLILIPS